MSESKMTPMEVVIPENVEQDNLAAAVSNSGDGWDKTESKSDDQTVADNTEDETDDQTDEPDTDKSDDDDAADDTADNDDADAAADKDDDQDKAPADDEEADTAVRDTVADVQSEADAVQALLGKSGIDYNALVSEYKENDGLTKESIKKLADAGFGENLVTGYIKGQQARLDIYSDRVMAIAGGEVEYGKLVKWASKNLSEAEITHYDKMVESNDIDAARFAIKGLMARRAAAVGVEPKLVKGKSVRLAGSVKGYASLEEMASAQDDPRYETDEAYTRMVERRMLASNF